MAKVSDPMKAIKDPTLDDRKDSALRANAPVGKLKARWTPT
jgi:hypothetical protein